MVDKETADALWSRYNKAMNRVSGGGKGLTIREGGVGADVEMGAAYKELVRAGLAAPLRKKYTRGGNFGAR